MRSVSVADRLMVDRPRVIALVIAIAGTLAGWIVVLGAFIDDETFGIDFGVFHAGGRLIRTDGFDAAYDPDRFSPFFVSDYYPALAGERSVSHFISSPPFGWLMQPLSLVPFDVAMWLAIAFGFVLLIPAVRMLNLPTWAAAVLAVSPAMAQNVQLAQIGTVVLIAIVALHLACTRSRLVLAGLIAGLFILKPTLAIGFGLWWLIDIRRWYKSILIAAASGVVISLPTFAGSLDPWRGFLDAMRFRVDAEGQWQQQSLSVPEWLKLTYPFAPGWLTVLFWMAGSAAAGAMLVAARNRFGDDLEVMSAAAVVATVVASPHLLVYDSLILVIPVAVAARRGLLDERRVILLAAIHVGTIAFGPGIYLWQYGLIGHGVGLELVGLVLCLWLLVKWSEEGPVAVQVEERIGAAGTVRAPVGQA